MNDQRSTTDQLRDLIQLANEHGLYDAADFCQREVERAEREVERAGRCESRIPPPDGGSYFFCELRRGHDGMHEQTQRSGGPAYWSRDFWAAGLSLGDIDSDAGDLGSDPRPGSVTLLHLGGETR